MCNALEHINENDCEPKVEMEYNFSISSFSQTLQKTKSICSRNIIIVKPSLSTFACKDKNCSPLNWQQRWRNLEQKIFIRKSFWKLIYCCYITLLCVCNTSTLYYYNPANYATNNQANNQSNKRPSNRPTNRFTRKLTNERQQTVCMGL